MNQDQPFLGRANERAPGVPRAPGRGEPLAVRPGDAIGSAAALLFPSVPVRVSYRRQRRQLFRFLHHADGSVDIYANDVFRSAPDPVAAALVQIVLGRKLPLAVRRALSTIV